MKVASVVMALAVGALADPGSMAGYGYSSDTQQVSQQACYSAGIQTVNRESSHIELDTAMSFSDLEHAVRRSVDVGGGVGMFSVDAEASYLKAVQDKEYSLSLNYYQYTSASVSIQLNGTGLNGLTDFGAQMYANGTNPYFRVVCGDAYLTSYEEGALLMLSINVVMSCKEEVAEFRTAISAGLDDIVSATDAVTKITAQRSFSGRVEMSAFQAGGKPENLAGILSKDSSQQYYVLTCSFGNMADCQQAANGLLTYATQNFSTQFSFDPNQGLSYLGEGFYTYEPAQYIGLTMPPSLVTPQVTTARQNLATALRENEYYLQSLYPLTASYAVEWDQSSDTFRNITSAYKTADGNLDIILGYNNPEQGAKGCFDLPDQCVALSQNIIASLAPVTPYLGFLPGIQYILPVGVRTADDMLAAFYPNGVGYDAAALPPPANEDHFENLVSVTLNSTYLSYFINYIGAGGKHGVTWNNWFSGPSTTNGYNYTGQSCYEKPGDSKSEACSTQTFTRQQSGYFFGPFVPPTY
eukprot:TRINITY_DN334_c0_g2_i3.p1 TRINITY_DN334_c0_g2~~TRINITY_DN334_c0_g2_i3.p1  ORF type:complete len:542 (+),score=217.08 TRINITY_DN334_c0_g2_i3:52-1626(+)